MSKHNYTNYAKTQETPVVEPEVKPVIDEPVVAPETPVAPQVDPEPVVETEDDEVIGYVTECAKLNVRKEPSKEADVVTVIPLGAEVMIDDLGSTEDFYKVCTETGVEGYCMKKFINVY